VMCSINTVVLQELLLFVTSLTVTAVVCCCAAARSRVRVGRDVSDCEYQRTFTLSLTGSWEPQHCCSACAWMHGFRWRTVFQSHRIYSFGIQSFSSSY